MILSLSQMTIQFPGHGCMDDLTTEQSFDLQATWTMYVVGLQCNMSSMDVCATRHWQKSGRVAQQINACAVYYSIHKEGLWVNQLTNHWLKTSWPVQQFKFATVIQNESTPYHLKQFAYYILTTYRYR